MNLAEMVSGDNAHITPEMARKSWQHFITQEIPEPVVIVVKPPSLWRKIINYTKSLVAHTFSGFGYASWPEVWKRRRTCNACPQRDPKTDSCKSCGCSLHGTILGDKLRWKSSQCPLGKW